MHTARLFILLTLTTTIIGCGEFRKLQKSGDWKTKYDAALVYYDQKDYHRAEVLLSEIRPIIRGTAEAELAEFKLAYCYYYQQQYLLSAHHFQEFIRVYGRSEYLIEAQYRNAHSLYLQSPDYPLDQAVTYEAIDAMQNFIEQYPDSDYAQEADASIDQMQLKLEKKAFEQCKLYYRVKRYKAALVNYGNFQNDYPGSMFQEAIADLEIKTHYDFAKVSIYSKQEERYQSAINAYLAFVDKYPESEFLKDLEKIYAESIEEITKFAHQK